MNHWFKKLILITLVLPQLARAEEPEFSPSKLEALGLPDKIPNLLLSSLSQGFDYIEHIEATEEARGQTESIEGFVLFSRDPENDFDFRARFDPEAFDDEKRLVEDIGRFVRTQYRIRHYGSTYDPESIVVTRESDSVTLVTLGFLPYALPQDVAFFRFMEATFRIEDRVLKSAVVTNNRHFRYQGKRIDRYRQEIQFALLDTGACAERRCDIEDAPRTLRDDAGDRSRLDHAV